MAPDLSPLPPPPGAVGDPDPLPPPPHPEMVMATPLSIERRESRVNSRRSSFEWFMPAEEQAPCPCVNARNAAITQGGAARAYAAGKRLRRAPAQARAGVRSTPRFNDDSTGAS